MPKARWGGSKSKVPKKKKKSSKNSWGDEEEEHERQNIRHSTTDVAEPSRKRQRLATQSQQWMQRKQLERKKQIQRKNQQEQKYETWRSIQEQRQRRQSQKRQQQKERKDNDEGDQLEKETSDSDESSEDDETRKGESKAYQMLLGQLGRKSSVSGDEENIETDGDDSENGDEDEDEDDEETEERSEESNGSSDENENSGEKNLLDVNVQKNALSEGKEVLQEAIQEKGDDDDDDDDDDDALLLSDDECKDGENNSFRQQFLKTPIFSVQKLQQVEKANKIFYDCSELPLFKPVKNCLAVACGPPMPQDLPSFDMEKLGIRRRLLKKFVTLQKSDGKPFSELQQSLFACMNSYRDIYFASQDKKNRNDIRQAYLLHVLNHVLQSRDAVMQNDEVIKKQSSAPDTQATSPPVVPNATLLSSLNDIEEHRDQGFTRPKVLLLTPFRSSAEAIMNDMIHLLPESIRHVHNLDRFKKDYAPENDPPSCDGKTDSDPPKKDVLWENKPEDFKELFGRNNDDHFQCGISFARHSVRLYADYSHSDIILASPLGLRMKIGAEGEKDRDFDFLSSIEVVVLDQADVFFMQNWSHVVEIMKVINLLPQASSNETDFARVREWNLEGHAPYFRQTLMFSSVMDPRMKALLKSTSKNQHGSVHIRSIESKGAINYVVPQVKQIFQRLPTSSSSSSSPLLIQHAADARFEYFKDQVLSTLLANDAKHVLVYIPDYYDYVRVRNYFAKEVAQYSAICEYTSNAKITMARAKFYQGQSNILLYTERLHFFRRFQIRGVHQIIFYAPPTYAPFYTELLNMVQEMDSKGTESSLLSILLYSKYDKFALEHIVGTSRATKLLSRSQNTFMFC